MEKPMNDHPCPRKTGLRGRLFLVAMSLIFIGILVTSCVHIPDDTRNLDQSRMDFDGDQKTVLKAIRSVLLNRDLGEATETYPERLETDYVVQGDWRTKVIATVRQVGHRRAK
jgi:hypothetical protein